MDMRRVITGRGQVARRGRLALLSMVATVLAGAVGRRRSFGVMLATSALLVVVLFPSTSFAGRLFPVGPIDAATGESAIQLGAAIGNRQAWAGFAQETAGATRLYIRYARNGRLRATAQLADRGNEVTAGGLVGDGRGRALVVWEEQVGNDGVLFSRRLGDGVLGPVIRVSPPGSDAEFGDLMNPQDRGRSLVMSRTGAAALCYDDGNDHFIASRGAGSDTWARHEVPRECIDDNNNSDLGIDDRGHVVALTLNGAGLFADKVIRGQVVSELVTDDAGNQNSLAVGPGGTALAVGRDQNMNVFARRKADIAQGGPWVKVGGNLQQGLLIEDGRSPEDPYAAMDSRGNGILAFRDNAMNGSQVLYRLLNAGIPGGGAALYTSIGRSSRVRLGVDRLGRPFTAYTKARTLDANKETVTGSAYARVFARGEPGLERALAPGILNSGAPNVLGFAVDQRGNFLALPDDFTNANVSRVLGTFGDFSRPNVRPRAFPRRPRAGQRVRLASLPFDSFRLTRPGDVLWSLPRGVRVVRAFKRSRGRARGRKIRVRFRRAGVYRIGVKIGDGSGNSRTKTLRIRVRRAR